MTTKKSQFTALSVLKSIPQGKIIISILIGLMQSALSILWPILIYKNIKQLSELSFSNIILDITLIIILFSLAQWFQFRHTTYNLKIIDKASLHFAGKIYLTLTNTTWQEFKRHDRVYYYDLLLMDFWRVRQGVMKIFESVFSSLLTILFMMIMIAWISPLVFLASIFGLSVMTLLAIFINRKNRPFIVGFQQAWKKQHRLVVSILDKFELLKLSRGVENTKESHAKETKNFLQANSEMLEMQQFWQSWLNWGAHLFRVATLMAGIYLIQTKLLSMEEFIICLLLLSIIQGHIPKVSSALFAYMDAQEAARSLNDFFSKEYENIDEKSSNVVKINSYLMKNISFSYGDNQVIHNRSISLEAGNIYLWKGKNGHGKSTMARITLGHLTPDKGTIFINKEKYLHKKLVNFRSSFALVDQNTKLFSGTIEENIMFGYNNIEGLWDEIKAKKYESLLPRNKNTNDFDVGEGGENLSGGEIRKVALIREMLVNSDILILDEPTNHLDQSSIAFLKTVIQTMKQSKIIIIISHLDEYDDIADEIMEF